MLTTANVERTSAGADSADTGKMTPPILVTQERQISFIVRVLLFCEISPLPCSIMQGALFQKQTFRIVTYSLKSLPVSQDNDSALNKATQKRCLQPFFNKNSLAYDQSQRRSFIFEAHTR
jgi:hypothetical protein